MITRTVFFYVQDERYAAGAGMRRSGFSQIRTISMDERYAAGAGMRRSGFSQIRTISMDERYKVRAGTSREDALG